MKNQESKEIIHQVVFTYGDSTLTANSKTVNELVEKKETRKNKKHTKFNNKRWKFNNFSIYFLFNIISKYCLLHKLTKYIQTININLNLNYMVNNMRNFLNNLMIFTTKRKN